MAPETILYKEHPSWLCFYGLILMGVAVIVIAGTNNEVFLVSVLFVLAIAYARYRRLYTITDHRIIMRTGLIANNSNELEIMHIRGINVRQSVIERLLGIGTLEFFSTTDARADVVFSGIRNPEAVKEQIRTLRPAP
jgi:uncharacterized membrane protein YdbT with pleckstrin-like domain